MTQQTQDILNRINALWDTLPQLTGTAEKVLIDSCTVIREIGLHLTSLMGKPHSWTRGRWIGLACYLPFDFDKAQECVALYVQLPERVTSENAANYIPLIFRIMGKSKRKHRPRKAERAASPSAVIYCALESARVTTGKLLKDKAEWGNKTLLTVNKILAEHKEWINSIVP
jgi:hypothetical protein